MTQWKTQAQVPSQVPLGILATFRLQPADEKILETVAGGFFAFRAIGVAIANNGDLAADHKMSRRT